MKKTILIATIVVSLLLIIGAGYVFFSGGNNSSSTGGSNAPASSPTNAPKEKTVFFSLGDSFITNIKNSTRYLKVNISLEINDEKYKAEYEKNSTKLKDAVISVLRNKSENDLLAATAQEDLKADIKNVLLNKLSLKDLSDVYINEFIIQ